jgi:hypothetical protein
MNIQFCVVPINSSKDHHIFYSPGCTSAQSLLLLLLSCRAKKTNGTDKT